MSERIVIKVKKSDGSSLPKYMTDHSAGADVYASSEVTIQPGEVTLVPTGLFLEIPVGYEVQVRPRSGLALNHGLILPNSPGTIDSDYRGEFKVILMNLGKQVYHVKKGDRIAQMVAAKVVQAGFEETTDLATSARGHGGFGSTGKN